MVNHGRVGIDQDRRSIPRIQARLDVVQNTNQRAIETWVDSAVRCLIEQESPEKRARAISIGSRDWEYFGFFLLTPKCWCLPSLFASSSHVPRITRAYYSICLARGILTNLVNITPVCLFNMIIARDQQESRACGRNPQTANLVF